MRVQGARLDAIDVLMTSTPDPLDIEVFKEESVVVLILTENPLFHPEHNHERR